jgi:hypothetical protein
MDEQVISWAKAHAHQVMTFVPYFNVQNLATLSVKHKQ